MWETLFFTIGFVAIAILLLGIKVFFVRGGKFPNIHIGANKKLSDKGITCAISTDRKERHEKHLSDLITDK